MKRPNILLLHTDQQRFDTIYALGASYMHTPNLDRLVQMGMTFTSAYSSNPVCMPARHDLITGVSARHHGYWHNAHKPIADYGLATVPRLLTQVGYQTFAVGKMHFMPEREHHGFAHMFLMEELPELRENDAYLQYLERVGYGQVHCQHGVRPLFYHTPQVSRVPEEHHGSAWVAYKTIELIRQERDRPFFIFASWVGPHPPYYMPKEYLELYQDADIPTPILAPEGMERQTPPTPEDASPERLQRIREAYYGATTLIDKHIGRILDTLEETGQLNNTLIIFTSDHGEMLGDRGAYQKHIPYEGSAHIPFILCGPGFASGKCDTPVTTWDVPATILKAADIEVLENHPLVGESLEKVIEGASERIVVFHHSQGQYRYVAAVGHAHKFIHWFNGGEEELYDLQNDPSEHVNLLNAPDQGNSSLCDALRQACIEFEREHGIAENVSGDAFVDLPWQKPYRRLCDINPEWSSYQFPRWMVGYSEEDLQAIAQEMNDCLNSDAAYICKDPQWREMSLQKWQEIGGVPEVYKDLFQKVDD